MADRTYRLANQALEDLNDITDEIASARPTAASRVLDALLAAFELLAEHPEAGVARSDLRTNLRLFVPGSPADNYVIFYYPLPNGIEVSDVIHGRRDWPGMFLRGER